ncbi:GNAT family N-acetyltransferase [Myroides marinus]|uniref:GNAT family N-acetyltransferase n=1 Tax=Myroides marinus TaxID=703342 RepID=UPI00257722B6|nr:GNAT family N-acetyltransferase [Myroides marinus]MDM1356052.1 GNAT family N-acetyltransferase [Myroides marinus]
MLTTERLMLNRLSHHENAFMLELVNTPGWLQFIGDRNIHNASDAQEYIQKILDNNDSLYWVVSRKEDNQPIGLISLIKRDYLDHHDIGFAFLPNCMNMGYAYEATHYLLNILLKEYGYKTIYAIVLPENKSSIKLLERLHFNYEKIVQSEDETLKLYTIESKS